MRHGDILDLILAAGIVLLGLATPGPSSRAESVAGPLEAEVIEVVDGDSLRVRVHIWLGQQVETLVRIRGIDTPERRGRCSDERVLASAAQRELERLVAGRSVILSRIAADKYGGRVLADVRLPGGGTLALALLAGGFARAYDGGARESWCERPAKTGKSVLFSGR